MRNRKSLLLLSLLLTVLLVSCTSQPATTAPAVTTPQETVTTTAATSMTSTILPATDDEPTEHEWILNTTNLPTYKGSDIGVMIRELTIETAKGGDPVIISHLTDTHIIYFTPEDLEDPFYKSVYDAYNDSSVNGWPLGNVRFAMTEATKNTHAVVVTGDVTSCYSPGSLMKANEYIFSQHENVLAALGNHDITRTDVHSHISDPMSTEEVREHLAEGWPNDVIYTSQVLMDKVMLIVMDNGNGFHSEQVPLLNADLERARENGYAVLLFYHVPLNTGRTEDNNISPTWGSHQNWSFGTVSGYVGPQSKGADGQIYSLIRRNGDIIRGCFCGHVHGDFYTEIPAVTFDGEETMIPQYVLSATMLDRGHVMRITVR